MAFTDLPQIDTPSENDNEAMNRFEAKFSQKAGFISRAQTPDKGCDYQVELIHNQKASHWQFGVQLKSIQQPQFIENDTLISYSWHTSRLGYMMRNPPIYGLLVIYNVSTETLYFEHIEKIYQKLLERETDDWKERDKVSVHVSKANVLNTETLKEIHNNYIQRYNNLGEMSQMHGKSFNLPVPEDNDKAQFNLQNHEEIVDILKRWGLSSLLLDDIPIIYDLIGRLPNNKITQHKELCILAALAYNEVGKIADSQFYLERGMNKFQLSEGEQQMMEFTRIKNDYQLGITGSEGFIQVSKSLLKRADENENQIVLRMNILFFELGQIKSFMTIPQGLAKEIADLAESIELLSEKTSKYYLKIYNLDNLSRYAHLVRNQGFNEMTVMEKFGTPLNLSQRKQMAEETVALQHLFYHELGCIDKFAKASNNALLQAHAILAKTRGSLSLEIDLITFSENAQADMDKEERMTHEIKLAEHAMQVFLRNNLTGPAYTILCLASELHTILKQWYNLNSPVSDQLMTENLQTLETELELPPYQSSVTGLIELRKKPETPDMGINSGMSGLLQLNSEQIENIAKTTMRSLKFPNAKMEYVLAELYSFKTFYQRCTDPNIQPKVNTLPANFTYAVSPVFYLYNTNTNLRSADNPDMDALLSSWGF